jgi:hypothetical protein
MLNAPGVSLQSGRQTPIDLGEVSKMYQTDSPEHRLWSASATFQKGLYHLFILQRRSDADAYARVLRAYQVLFLLVETGYLLDLESKIPKPQNRFIARLIQLGTWDTRP